jgi:hypothetical protein
MAYVVLQCRLFVNESPEALEKAGCPSRAGQTGRMGGRTTSPATFLRYANALNETVLAAKR